MVASMLIPIMQIPLPPTGTTRQLCRRALRVRVHIQIGRKQTNCLSGLDKDHVLMNDVSEVCTRESLHPPFMFLSWFPSYTLAYREEPVQFAISDVSVDVVRNVPYPSPGCCRYH